MQFSALIVSIIVLISMGVVEPHGYLQDPMARNVIWRENPAQPPQYHLSGLWCDDVKQDMGNSRCGICGDPVGQRTPRDNEHGGIYGNGIIAKNYTAGQIINLDIVFTATHYGFFEVELCSSGTETASCFQRLVITEASMPVRIDNRVCVTGGGQQTSISAKARLPSGVRCNRCTLRWTYRTSYGSPPGWDQCYDPEDAQTFRNCADIAIL